MRPRLPPCQVIPIDDKGALGEAFNMRVDHLKVLGARLAVGWGHGWQPPGSMSRGRATSAQISSRNHAAQFALAAKLSRPSRRPALEAQHPLHAPARPPTHPPPRLDHNRPPADLVFLSGTPTPMIALLYEDTKEARHVQTYIVDLRAKVGHAHTQQNAAQTTA